MALPLLLGKTFHHPQKRKTHIKDVRKNGFEGSKIYSEVAKPRREKYNSDWATDIGPLDKDSIFSGFNYLLSLVNWSEDQIITLLNDFKTLEIPGAPGWLSQLSSDFGSGHDLTVREFEPHVRLYADNSEPGACFGFCVSLLLPHAFLHSLSLKNE